MNYYELSAVYAKKNLLFDFITTAERIDLDYEMKMTVEFTPKTIENITDKINTYYQNAQKRMDIISEALMKVCGELK